MSAAQKNLRNYMRQNCVSDEKSLWNKGRTSIQGQALYVRSARRTAQTIEVWAVLRHSVPYKGLHPLRRLRAYPSGLCSGNRLLAQTIPAAKPENPYRYQDRLPKT